MRRSRLSTHIFRYQKVHAPTDVHRHKCKENELEIDSDRYSTCNYDRNRCIQIQNSRALSAGCSISMSVLMLTPALVELCQPVGTSISLLPPLPPSFLTFFSLTWYRNTYISPPSLPLDDGRIRTSKLRIVRCWCSTWHPRFRYCTVGGWMGEWVDGFMYMFMCMCACVRVCVCVCAWCRCRCRCLRW